MCSERGSQGWYDWAEQNLHNDTRGQFTMRGDTVQIRLVGVNVDNRADGKGKAGLTFMTTTYVSEADTNMADTDNNAGGYRDVRNRRDYNVGRYKSTISSDVYQYLTPVLKSQNNQSDYEMNSDNHSATNNAIVEKISMPSPLELNMNVTQDTYMVNNYNGPTPSGVIQYNPNKTWFARYNYLYSGNAPYEYYKNNTSDIGEYCKLMKSYFTPSRGWPCNNIRGSLWLRAFAQQEPANFFADDGDLRTDVGSSSYNYRAAALLSF